MVRPAARTFIPITVAALSALLGLAAAREPVTTKLHPSGGQPGAGVAFGTGMAINHRWILAGDPFWQDGEFSDGAVHVFDAESGRRVRRLSLPGVSLGEAVAIDGELAVATDGLVGEVHGFDLRTGRWRWSLPGNMGSSVAVAGSRLVVGLPGGPSGKGGVALYSLSANPPEWVESFERGVDARAGDGFGTNVAICGDLLAASGSLSATDGFVYLFDLRSGRALWHWTDPSPDFGRALVLTGDRVVVAHAGRGIRFFSCADGSERTADEIALPSVDRLAASGNLLLAGASQEAFGAGAAYLFDLNPLRLRRRFASPAAAEIGSGHRFGAAVALCGERAVIGAPGDEDLGYRRGAAYLIRPLVQFLPLTTRVQTGDFAPGLVGASFISFRQPVINPEGNCAFQARIAGPGIRRGQDEGNWLTFSAATQKLLGTGDLVEVGSGPESLQVTGSGPPLYNQTSSVVFPASLKRPGPGWRAREAVFRRNYVPFNHDSLDLLLRLGEPVSELGDAAPARFFEILQAPESEYGVDYLTIPYQLRVESLSGVSRTNDSGIFVVAGDGTAMDDDAREGNVAPGVEERFGQFFGRATATNVRFYALSAWVVSVSGGPPLQACFTKDDTSGGSWHPVARQGELAPQLPGDPELPGHFRSMLGETISADGLGLVRATQIGFGLNEIPREGLFYQGAATRMLGKGDEIEPGSGRVSRILRFWPVGSYEAIVWLKLSGPGVKPDNDCMLAHAAWQEASQLWTWQRLLREGDSACDADGSRLRVIQQVEVDPRHGHYAILASLTGNPARNQALFTGEATTPRPPPGAANDASALRLPHLVLRKGTLFGSTDSGTTRLRSISLQPVLDPTGAGGKGHGKVINEAGELVLCLRFDDGSTELVTGKP